MTRASDPVWYADVRILPRRPLEFFPSRDQSPEERVNSIVRLLAYVTTAMFVYRRRTGYLLFGLACIALVSLSFVNGRRCTRQPGGQGGQGGRRQHCSAGSDDAGGGADDEERRPAVFGGVRVPHTTRTRPECVLSTPENPFANFLLTDDPSRPPACKYDEQSALIRKNFNRGLVRNAYDVYEKENSQRQYVTNPVTTSIPDTVAFAHFCFGRAAGRQTCKEDPTQCTGALP